MTFVNCQEFSATVPLLRTHAWLDALPIAALLTLASQSRPIHFTAGELILRHGQPCSDCLLVVAGQLQGLRYTQDGDEKVFGNAGAGAWLSLHAVFHQPALHWHTIRAVSDGQGCLIRAAALRQICLDVPAFALQIIEHGARLLHHHTEQIDWLTSSTAEQRLAAYILRCWSTQAAPPDQALPLSWGQIATKLGMRAETLSRLLAKWRRQGYLRYQRACLRFVDTDALQRLVSAG